MCLKIYMFCKNPTLLTRKQCLPVAEYLHDVLLRVAPPLRQHSTYISMLYLNIRYVWVNMQPVVHSKKDHRSSKLCSYNYLYVILIGANKISYCRWITNVHTVICCYALIKDEGIQMNVYNCEGTVATGMFIHIIVL